MSNFVAAPMQVGKGPLIMPRQSHLRGVSPQEQRQYERILAEAEKSGRYQAEDAASTWIVRASTATRSPKRGKRALVSRTAMDYADDAFARRDLNSAIERRELRVIPLRNVDAQPIVQRQHKIEEVDRVEVELVAKLDVGTDRRRIDLRRNSRQRLEDDLLHLVGRHNFSGVCSKRSTAARKSPPRCPSLARWSADSVAVTSGLASTFPETTHGRSWIRPKPTSATCGG